MRTRAASGTVQMRSWSSHELQLHAHDREHCELLECLVVILALSAGIEGKQRCARVWSIGSVVECSNENEQSITATP